MTVWSSESRICVADLSFTKGPARIYSEMDTLENLGIRFA